MLAGVMETYEVGFLLSPLIAVEALVETLEREFKAPLAASDAKFKTESAPRLIKLAYPLRKVVEHKSTVFNEAYFGSMVFDAAPGVVQELARRWRQSPLIIRLLLITYPERLLLARPRRAPDAAPVNPEAGSAPNAHPATAVTAIDQEIENLLTPIV